VSNPAYEIGHEHFCEHDVVATMTNMKPWSVWPMPVASGESGLAALAGELQLDRDDRGALLDRSFPVRLDTPPEPATFCSACLKWFTNPQPGGSESQPPEKGTTNA
jgi:hypothetical protein